MTSKAEKFVKTYKTLAQIPAITGGKIKSNGIISSSWSQRNLERGKSTRFIRQFFTKDLKKLAETAPIDISTEVLSKDSPSEKFRAILRDVDSKQYLEVWRENNNIRTVDLSALDLHGPIYYDGEFTSFEWSPDETKILYVAEKKCKKSEPFYKRKPPTAKKPEENGDNEEKSVGEEFSFEQDWGEQLVSKKQSVIAEYSVENDTVEILKGIPDGIFPAQPKYAPDGSHIIGVAYYLEPRKLGLIFCANRPNTLFTLDFEGNYFALPLLNLAVKSPIFTPDGHSIVWLQRRTGGPHASCMQLVRTELPLTVNSVPRVVVDIVDTEIQIEGGKTFHGLYNTGFIARPWASDNRLIVNTSQKYTLNSYVINIDNGAITELDFQDGSQVIIDVYKDTLLGIRRNFLKPDQLVVGHLPESRSSFDQVTWFDLTSSETVPGLENCMYKYLDLVHEGDGINFNAIYVGPKSGADKSVPLIVWPHGGPHSCFGNYLFLEGAMSLYHGQALLLVNFRGSLGAGQASVDFLLGKAGTADVEDCVRATDVALDTFPWLNSDAVALKGGSHGGFLVTHLSGQYPDKYKAVVARNPVIDVAAMSIVSDIPDWCYVEAGKEYTQTGKIDDDMLVAMRKMSPIVYAHEVRAPTLLLLGSKDLRVPASQGTEYYLRLKANGVTTRMNMYDDNHPLGTVPNEMDTIINSLLWIDTHLDIES